MKKRNFEERSAMVAAFVSSGLDEETFSDGQGIKVSSLRRWLAEAKQTPTKKARSSGFVEVAGVSQSSMKVEVCRVVSREVAFEFESSPSAAWLGEFAAALVTGSNGRK